MAIPVYVKGYEVILVDLPLSSSAHRGILVFHVVGFHVTLCILAAGAINALPVQASIGIELHRRVQGIGQPLCQLVVSVSVHGLVPAVGNEKFRLRRILHRCVLPSVRVLQLKPRERGPLAKGKSHAVVLPHVTVTAHARTVIQ